MQDEVARLAFLMANLLLFAGIKLNLVPTTSLHDELGR